MSNKLVYLFSEGNLSMENLLGDKGANIAEMTRLGFPVPPGFTITTQVCNKYYQNNKNLSDDIIDQIEQMLAKTEVLVGKKFGDIKNPLLVSVRSGSRASMPDMMDTILNLGINDDVVLGLAKLTNNTRFAYDCYRRFIQMFSDVVMDLPKTNFERIIDKIKEENGITHDSELSEDNIKDMVIRFKNYYKKQRGEDFPQDPKVQLLKSIKAVLNSWKCPRAVVYRRTNDIPETWGTAVSIQSMIFGNAGNESGTGVAFTRNPSTGEKNLYGEFLMNAQGEDVVAGIRTPQSISQLKSSMPDVYEQFVDFANKLENHYNDMQCLEFTIENRNLYMLETRTGKRTTQAAIKIAIDLVNEGLIDKNQAILNVNAKQLDTLLHPTFNYLAIKNAIVLSTGLPSSPGAASGRVYFTAEEAVSAAKLGEAVILVRLETSPEDIEGMNVANGILTVRGGMTSHAAVVARGMGRCCIVGCGAIKVDAKNKNFSIGNKIIHQGEYISLDGSTGKVYEGIIITNASELTGDFAKLMEWADEIKTLQIRANADTPYDAQTAISFGAQGIGLCRTEHMFFNNDRISVVREMIVSKNIVERQRALEKLLPMQREDFEELFTTMNGFPVTIRLLDPPLHEFLPKLDCDIKKLSIEMDIEFEDLKQTVSDLHEFNPMLGHRGCRLAITYPKIAAMQVRAIIEAAINVSLTGIKVTPEIMIPLIGDVKELQYVKKIVTDISNTIIKETGIKIKYKIGTMIEVPRAAVIADLLASEAEFFSFGTNDLTQMTYGFSRDDAVEFLNYYYEKNVFDTDPFTQLDQVGVGKLMKIAIELGRGTRPNIELGICGEHGGDPSSIAFCHKIGLDYVSCSPFRVPIARLAAAQAKVNADREKQ